MRRIQGIAAIVFATAVLQAIPLRAARAFDGDRAKALDAEISSDRFEGRKSGLAGGTKIEQFVAERFEEYGLEPAGPDGSFFQEFPLLVTEERGGSMELLDDPFGAVKFLLGDDFTLITNSGSGDVTAEVVIVGHGLSDRKKGWDDYGDIDVEGKIVLIVRGAPENGYDWSEKTGRDSTLNEALDRGAAAVLWIRGDRAVNGAAIHEGVYDPDVPLAYVGERVVDHILYNSGTNLEQYKKKLKDAPRPFPTGKRLHFRADVKLLGEKTARNVLALLPGTDPVLASEVIVVGAHIDHIGINGNGFIYNGANDNGSGASLLLEMARSFAAHRERSRRTILFAGFAGEEQGLLGSTFLTENPIIAVGDMAAMFNFDMVGQGNGDVGVGGGEYFPEMWNAFRRSLDEESSKKLKTGRAWSGESSDHAPFRNKGVPVFNVWAEGDHLFYHGFEDDADWIDEEVIGSVGAIGEKLIGFAADWDRPLIPAHRSGAALLNGSKQIDFDGTSGKESPFRPVASVRWYTADRIGKHGFVLDVADDRAAAAEGDSFALAATLDDVSSAAGDGKRSLILGVEGDALEELAEDRVPLLDVFGICLARWPGFEPAPAGGDSARIREEKEFFERLSERGVAFLVGPDPIWNDRLPEGGLRLVRIFPSRGDSIADISAYPRKSTRFIVSLDRPIDAKEVGRLITSLEWSRVHLDIMPWLTEEGVAGVIEFLDRLSEEPGMTPKIVRGILGKNLYRR